MEITAWNQLYSAMHAQQEKRPFSVATLRRIAAFARPHIARLAGFLSLGVVTALLAVATPVLAGRVVDAIVGGGSRDTVVTLAVLIAVIAVVEAGAGLLARLLSAKIGEGLILDLRTRRVRSRAADAGRVLHPHPDRRARQPSQQRRHRRPARVQRHPVRRRRATSSRSC